MSMVGRWQRRLWRTGPSVLLGSTLALALFVPTLIRPGNVVGYAAVDVIHVGPAEGGVIETIAVEEGQEVLAGQVVAVLDARTLDAEIDVLMADQGLSPQLREARVDALQIRKKGRVLRAPVAGRVDAVFRRSGEVVAPGQSIVDLVPVHTSRVVACLGLSDSDSVVPGDVAVLFPRSGGPSLKGIADSIGASVSEKDLRCRVFAAGTEWGREVYVSVPDARLLPGQIFDIRFDRTGGSKVGSSTGEALPKELVVPPILQDTRRFEPSGAVWAPERERYIVVSDEIGERDPWVATVDRAGRADPEPVNLRNIRAVDDLESITPGADGAYWMLASQAPVGEGPPARERTMLMKTRPDLRVSSKTSLRETIEALGVASELIPGASLDELDIEGMAWRGGALYFGLRGPLIQGRALIWRLDDPDLLVKEDHLVPGQLTVWGEVSMLLESGEPAGITDMLFLPDGSLVLAGAPADASGGALFYLPDPAPGLSEAELLRSFPVHDPEGLALSPNPGRLTVFFDQGEDAPMWLEMPWPR